MFGHIAGFFCNFASQFWHISCLMAPWLLFGFLCGGLIAVFVPDSFIRKHLGGKGFAGIAKASLIGTPLPLCSCGVIPVAATLKRQGATNGTIASFIISTPQISISSFLPTWQLLSPAMALIRTLFAFLTGILGGVLINAMCPRSLDGTPENMASTAPPQTVAAAPRGNKLSAIFRYAFGTLMKDVGGTLLFGLSISALLGVFIPEDFGAQYASNTILVIPLIILISLPMYTCTNAAVPIAAMLMLKGFSPGAAMAFLIAGPSCSAPMLALFWKLLGRRAMLIYIVMMTVLTLTVCWGIDLLGASIPGLGNVHAGHEHGIPLYQQIFAGLMLAIIFFNRFAGKFRPQARLTAAPGQIVLYVPDMTCGHCRQTIAAALNALPGVSFVDADLKNRRILVQAPETMTPLITAELKKAGFNVQ